MSDSRERILGRVRQALGRQGAAGNVAEAFDDLIRSPDSPVQPPFPADVVDTFSRAAKANAAEVHAIADMLGFPGWIERRANALNRRPPLVLAPEAAVLARDLSAFAVGEHVGDPHSWGVVRGCAGIAETGTVVSTSVDCPAGLLFRVERLIVILDKADIVACQEDIWERLRRRFPDGFPRVVNLITGPSRTADVEQTVQLGAHGPRWVDYVITGL